MTTTNSTKKALLIGINYTGTPNALEGCINDVLNMRAFLVDHCGYLAENITLLTDNTDVKPTFANLQAHMLALVQGAQAGDTLVMHYSGHGARIIDRSRDESDGRDEVLVPLDFVQSGFLSDDWIWQNVLNKVPAQVTLWSFMDSCHSGSSLDLRYNYRSLCRLKTGRLRPGPYVAANWTDQFTFTLERSRDLPANGGMVRMFSGALDPEYAADAVVDAQPQGAFTSMLLKTLEANVDPATQQWLPNRLRLRNALKEINCRLDLNGFLRQQCQLSASQPDILETYLNL